MCLNGMEIVRTMSSRQLFSHIWLQYFGRKAIYISFFAWSSFSFSSSVSGSSWYGLNWLFTTLMSSSSSTETSISSSSNIQWKHTIHNHSTCCFASETLVSDQSVNKSCPQHYVTRMKLRNKLVPVSWPFFDENWAVFSAKITAKFLFWRT